LLHIPQKRRAAGLLKLNVVTGRPLKLMLAQVGVGIEEALAEMGSVAVEWKFDGHASRYTRTGTKLLYIHGDLRM